MPTKPLPLVSVAIPTYRGAEHLGATIESVLQQTLNNFELIVIDDNSPDNTREVIASYPDPRLIYLRNENNLGPEGNWNRCLTEARGKYFKLLPQDDTLFPDTLERQVDVLEKDVNEHIALVFGSRKIINGKGRVLATRGCPGAANGRVSASWLIRRCVRRGTNLIGEPGSVLLRTSLATKVGAFDASIPYIIDLDYWVRLLRHGDAVYMVKPVSTFRVSPGSWSVAIGARQSEEFLAFVTMLHKYKYLSIASRDVLMTRLTARLNNIMRLVFYKILM